MTSVLTTIVFGDVIFKNTSFKYVVQQTQQATNQIPGMLSQVR